MPDAARRSTASALAALIAEGLTNSQLAERLYISPRTAAVHVSNILMKLALSGRAEVAAWAVRHGVVLPYNYWNRLQWDAAFDRAGVVVDAWDSSLGLYAPPLGWVFDRSLHFIARLRRR